MMYIVDITWWLYLASIFSAAWGFFLFTWWGQKTWRITKERPSSVFICLWLLFFGELIDNGISLHMRSSVISLGFSHQYSFFRSYLWSARVLPELLAMIAINYIMTYRVIFKKTVFKKNGHRSIIVEEGIVEKGKVYELVIKDAIIKEVK
jgi:hypothetical protein